MIAMRVINGWRANNWKKIFIKEGRLKNLRRIFTTKIPMRHKIKGMNIGTNNKDF